MQIIIKAGVKMNKKVAIVVIFILLTSFLVFSLKTISIDKKSDCSKIDSKSCKKDYDCICGGKDMFSNECFLGNVDYYEKCVDKNKECPDFCRGITGWLKIKCINNRCVQT